MSVVAMHDPELLLLIQSHKKEGAEALCDHYAKILGLAIFRIVREGDVTNELLEKTICQIWNTIDQYNKQDMPLLTWMLAIAKGLAKKFTNVSVIGISA